MKQLFYEPFNNSGVPPECFWINVGSGSGFFQRLTRIPVKIDRIGQYWGCGYLVWWVTCWCLIPPWAAPQRHPSSWHALNQPDQPGISYTTNVDLIQNRWVVSYRWDYPVGTLKLYTMNPWKPRRKSMGEWDYRIRIIPLLSSLKPGHICKLLTPKI
jgi:hypothetical protein